MGLLAQIGFVILVISAVPFWIAFAYSIANMISKLQKKEIRYKKQEGKWFKRFGMLFIGALALMALSLVTGI